MPASRSRNGGAKAGSIRTTRAAGSNGTAATIWAAACRTRTGDRSGAGTPSAAMPRRSGRTASRAIDSAGPGSGRPCCSGPTTVARCRPIFSGRRTPPRGIDRVHCPSEQAPSSPAWTTGGEVADPKVGDRRTAAPRIAGTANSTALSTTADAGFLAGSPPNSHGFVTRDGAKTHSPRARGGRPSARPPTPRLRRACPRTPKPSSGEPP